MTDRSALWKDVWIRKGLDRASAPHVADGYDLLSADEWRLLIERATRPIGLRGDERIVECGCGAGAFLDALLAIHPGLQVSGVDYSPTLLERAQSRLAGTFFVADVTDLGPLPSESCDHTLSFGVMIYLASEDAARRAIAEMLRVTRSGGTAFIGDVSDAARRAEAETIRKTSHRTVRKLSESRPDHLYLSKAFFEDVAREHGAGLTTIDHAEFGPEGYEAAKYRFSAYLRKPGAGA